MGRILLSITGEREETLELEVLDEATALLVADINVVHGNAELWDGDRRIARLTKHGGTHGTFWEIAGP
ncbi:MULTISPECIES: hypothetical protein [Qipengyuania]|uniref:Uncharacterized protein n=1 Tax=Qipengyuania soli TaxID=2782568 RepID=A0A7S8IVV5_9SPHN|nr:hypothetical protein [Qipengyuania soli]QPC99271.1 hypothetical protein IRL76_01435 [Qipengyuania soli]